MQNEIDTLRQQITNLELELGRRPKQPHPGKHQTGPAMVANDTDIE